MTLTSTITQSGNRSNNTPVYSHGRPCGYVRSDKVFYRKIASSQILQRPPAMALTVEVLDQVKRAGAKQIHITDTDSGLIYTVSMALFLEKSFTLDRGYGMQYALPLVEWECSKPGEAKQLSLMGVMQ